jgi:hypothetical protein
MNGFSRQMVVEQMTHELAERRRTSASRRRAYLALALAILGEEHADLLDLPSAREQSAA